MSLESTTSEESTTSSREGRDEPWYREAVNSSSSELEEKENHVTGTIRSKIYHQTALPVNDLLLKRPII